MSLNSSQIIKSETPRKSETKNLVDKKELDEKVKLIGEMQKKMEKLEQDVIGMRVERN